MRKLATWVLAIGLVLSPAVMAANGSGNDKASDADAKKSATDSSKTDVSKTAKTDAAAPSSAELAAELDQMRELLKAQADQLDQQRQELAAMKASLSHNSASDFSATPAVASGASSSSMISTAPANSAAASASNAAPIAAPAATATAAAPAAPVYTPPQAVNTTEHSPLSFKIGDAQFTPGGFMDFTTVFRTTGTGNGIGTSFTGVPYNNSLPGAGLSELRFSAQNSRVALRVDAPVGKAKITGYLEADFLGLIAQNANVTSNSDGMRMRVYFGDYRRGKWEVVGGQDWSMLTPNRKGISPFPSDIFYTQDMDTNYQVGLIWTRQPQFRVLYHPNDAWTFGVSIENPDQLATGSIATPAGFGAYASQVDATSGGTLATPPTPNFVPDIIVKLANDEKLGDKLFHWEASGLFSEFKLFTPNAVTGSGNVTRTAAGGALSVNANLELFKNFRLIANTFFSDGGGRYIQAAGPDLAIKQATTTSPFVPSPVHSASGLGGIEYQATKTSFLDFYYGVAYVGRDIIVNPASGLRNLGYGWAGSSNSNNRTLGEYSLGWTQTFWQNPNYGKFQLITQGSYVTRAPWYLTLGAPKNAHLFMVYADLRYTLP